MSCTSPSGRCVLGWARRVKESATSFERVRLVPWTPVTVAEIGTSLSLLCVVGTAFKTIRRPIRLERASEWTGSTACTQ